MIFRSERVTADELARVTGWHVRDEGLCSGERCVPFATSDARAIPLDEVARALGRPVVCDPRRGLWALGAEAGGRALVSAAAPELALPDLHGEITRLSTLRGQKVLLVVWASW